MGKNKTKRGDHWGDWTPPVNDSDAENLSTVREVKTKNKPENANGPENNSAGLPIQDQSSTKLQLYTDTVWETTQALKAAQDLMQKLNGQYIKHMQDIVKVPEVHQDLAKLRQQCMKKDERIRQQKQALIALQTMSEEKEAELVDERNMIKKERQLLKQEEDDQAKKAKKVEERAKLQEAEMSYALEKKFFELKEEQSKEHHIRMEQLERDSKKREGEIQKKLINLGNLNQKLSTDLESKKKDMADLTERLKTAEGNYEDMKAAKASYKKDKGKLETKLKDLKNEFGMTMLTRDFYKGKFAEIAKAIEDTSFEHFKDLPSEDLDGIRKSLIDVDTCFNSVPISNTIISQNLRIVHVQRIISHSLFTHIWQSFSSERSLAYPKFGELLEAIYNELVKSSEHSGGGKRAASVWKVLTLRALQSLEQELPPSQMPMPVPISQSASHPSSRATLAVNAMLGKLSPLIPPSQRAQVQTSLHAITKCAIEIWDKARTDELKLSAFITLHPSTRNSWRSLKFDPLLPPDGNAGNSDDMDTRNSSTRPRIYTLFPHITVQSLPTTEAPLNIPGSFSKEHQERSITETEIHPGVGLPEWSALMVQGKAEEEERMEYLQKAMREFATRRKSG